MTTVVEKLQAAGIEATPYKRGPLGKDILALNLTQDRKRLRVWPGTADITVRTDKRFRQAVLSVDEASREITRSVTEFGDVEGSKLSFERGYGFPVALPPGTTYRVDSIQEVEQEVRWSHSHLCKAQVTATTPDTKMNFLIGQDEEHLFISMLPERVNSVREAHEALRPKDVPKGSLRQGEWFFVPVNEKLSKELDQQVVKRGRLYSELLDGGSHFALQSLSYKGEEYVIGFILDHQGFHQPLWLDEWHIPICNLELEPPGWMESSNMWD